MKLNMLSKGVVAALALSAANFANAGVYATSFLEIKGLGVSVDIDGDNVADEVNPLDYISITSASRTAGASADINSVGGSSTKTDSTGVGIANPNLICVGLACGVLTDNSVDIDSVVKTDSSNYAVADANVSGSALGQGASGFTYADAGLATYNDTAGGQSNITNGLTTTLNFTVADSIGISFSAFFDALVDAYADAASLLDSTITTVASASASFNIQIFPDFSHQNGGSGFLFSGVTFADDLEGSDSSVYLTNQSFNTGFQAFTAGDYQINITQSSTSAVELVPEPASLALFGLGLLGVAGVARRRKSA